MKPQPVVVTTICSECGLAWEAHGEKPTTSDCIRLLKAELAKRPAVTIIKTPATYPTYPYWYQYQGIGQTYSGAVYGQAINCSASTTTITKTPIVEAMCSASTTAAAK